MAVALSEADLDYFKRGGQENLIFWQRMGERPAFKGRSVLDVGCGVGRLCVDIGLDGAQKVVGLDTDARLIAFAQENLRQNYPQLSGKVEFKALELKEYRDLSFDYILSKDSFEHIMDLQGMLEEMKQRLKPGGRIYAGFGPLYNSPFGHHGRTLSCLPWAHLMQKESRIIARLNEHRARGGNIFTYKEGELSSIRDLGLNKLSLADYRRIFQQSGLRMVSFKVNRSTNPLSRLASLLRHLPFLEEYFTHTIYCVMEKENAPQLTAAPLRADKTPALH